MSDHDGFVAALCREPDVGTTSTLFRTFNTVPYVVTVCGSPRDGAQDEIAIEVFPIDEATRDLLTAFTVHDAHTPVQTAASRLPPR